MLLRKIALLLLLSLIAFPLGARLAGQNESTTPIGDVSFQALPHFPGGGELYVPVADWGMSFRLFHSPLLVRAEPRGLDREGALRVASGDESLLQATESAIYSGARWSILRTLFVSLLLLGAGALVLSRLWPPLGKRFPLWGLLFGSGLSATVFLLALLTYNPGAISQPSFYARGAELGQILGSIEREQEGAAGSYEDNFQKILSSVSALLSGGPLPEADGNRSFVLASDLHSNALALPALDELAKDKTVFFVGDFGLDGNDMEASLLAESVAGVGERVVAVSGNHDSTGLMRALAEAGATVLSSRGRLQGDRWAPGEVEIDGLSVRGWDDPLEWAGEPTDPDRVFNIDQVPGARAAAERELWSWWRRIRKKPDILLIHQPTLAEFLAGKLRRYPRPLTILVGHDHRQWVARAGNVQIVDAGSLGAGGIFGVGREEAEMAEIYFSEASGQLQTVDMIQIDPLRGAGRAERINTDQICSLPCRYRMPALP